MPDPTSPQQEIAEIDALIASLRKKPSSAAREQAIKELEEEREVLSVSIVQSV